MPEYLAPGVFVVFTTDHPKLAKDLKYLSMGDGPYWALYRPYHLTSLETPISIARAAPTICARKNVPPQSGTRPTWMNACTKLAELATRRCSM